MHPLIPGTRVGAWRVKAWQGQGAYGAVYRAERVGFRRSGPVALKVSLTGYNWRMEREVELLSRLSHPSIPRLVDRGGPWPPSGEEYPYFVMEWVQGVGLYAWAEQHAPTGKGVCRVLGQLARALEAHLEPGGGSLNGSLFPASQPTLQARSYGRHWNRFEKLAPLANEASTLRLW